MRVELRPLAARDADQVLVWRNAPEVAEHMYTDRAIEPDEHRAFIARALEGRDRRLFIIEVEGRASGVVSLDNLSQAWRRCDWAYYLGEPEARGRGVGAAVEYAVIEHVFGRLGLNKLWCEVLVENEAVWRLHESFGFRREAAFRAHVFKGGRFRDVVGLGLLAADWELERPRAEGRLRHKGFDPEALRRLP